MRLLRVIILLLLAGFVGLAVYAYVGDMSADPQPMRVPVQLDMGQPATTPAPAAEPAADGAAAPDTAAPETAAPDTAAADATAPATAAETAPDAAPAPEGNADASLD